MCDVMSCVRSSQPRNSVYFQIITDNNYTMSDVMSGALIRFDNLEYSSMLHMLKVCC